MRFAPYVLLPALGALALYTFFWPTEPLSYPEVIVPAARIIENEPDTVVRWRERITTVEVAPVVVATSESGGEAEVQAFCEPMIQQVTDTVYVQHNPRLLLRSVSHDPGYFGRPDQLTFTGPLNTGGLQQSSYAMRGGWMARTSGDSLLVRQPRFQVVKDYGELGVVGFIGFVIGRVF